MRFGSLKLSFVAPVALLLAFTGVAMAEKADVVGATYTQGSDGSYRFDVTVSHADSGWDHYADKWEVRGTDGTVYGTRELAHPHETEQPFTRSLSGVQIPDGVEEVVIRAHDKVHGWGGAQMVLPLKGRL